MGSWNVSCFISGLSINGCEPVYYIPLTRKKLYPQTLENLQYGIMRPTDFFQPATFPILGEYDTYGRLENIVRDKNVEHLEKFYGAPIEQIISPESKIFSCGVFVLKEIYDMMLKNVNDDYAKKEREKHCGNYGHRVRRYIRDKHTMIKICKRQAVDPNQSEENRAYARASLSDTISDIINTFDSFEVTFRLDGMALLEEMPNIKMVYFNKIVNRTFSKEFLDINMLYVALHACGKMYFPTVNGLQCGDNVATKKLSSLTNKIANRRIKER